MLHTLSAPAVMKVLKISSPVLPAQPAEAKPEKSEAPKDNGASKEEKKKAVRS